MKVHETKINEMIDNEISQEVIDIDTKDVIVPKNYAFILAYFTSTFNKMKYKKVDPEIIANMIDMMITEDMFAIQIYADKNKVVLYDTDCTCPRCKRVSPSNSTFCSNCSYINLLYKRSDLDTLLSKYKKWNSNYYIKVGDLFIYKNQYEAIVKFFTKYIKKILTDIYKPTI